MKHIVHMYTLAKLPDLGGHTKAKKLKKLITLTILLINILGALYLYFVFGVRLESGYIIGGHFWVTGVEPQRLAVVLVNSLLTQQGIN